MRSIGHETGRRGGRPVLSTRQFVELVPEGLGRAAAIVRQNPQGGVVHARRDIALAVERLWIEIGHDTDVEHPGDVSRRLHKGSGISERQALTHERVNLLLGGHVEQFAGHDCQIELRFGFRRANPLAVTLLCANRHLEQRCDDRIVLLIPRDQHRPSVDERGVALRPVHRVEMPAQPFRNGCPVLITADQMLCPGLVQKTLLVQVLEHHQRVGRFGKHALAQIPAQP